MKKQCRCCMGEFEDKDIYRTFINNVSYKGLIGIVDLCKKCYEEKLKSRLK